MRWSVTLILGAIMSVQLAWAAQDVPELIDGAIESLNDTCYEAQMYFLSELDAWSLQKVHIYHLAPDLYHVQPLAYDTHGLWSEAGYHYIENAAELVRVNNTLLATEEMPKRLFALNKSLTTKFLRDLSKYEGTIVLNGAVGGIEVYMLRQELSKEKPYTVTVGLDQSNLFPVYLSVEDGTGQQRVYFEMAVIEYLSKNYFTPQLAEKYFAVPEQQKHYRAPRRVSQVAPWVEVSPSVEAEAVEPIVPLFPTWLPDSYTIEGLSILNYSQATGTSEQAANTGVVFVMEVYGPGTETMSIFQTQDISLEGLSDPQINQADMGIYMGERDGWFVVVMADGLKLSTLREVAHGLIADETVISDLLTLTRYRDEIIQGVAENGN